MTKFSLQEKVLGKGLLDKLVMGLALVWRPLGLVSGRRICLRRMREEIR